MTEPNIHPEVAQRTRPVGELNLYPGNARRGNVEDIADSLVRNGQYKPIIVNRPDDTVLVGNHTLQAARSLGWDRIGVQYVTVDEDRARAIVLRDNKASDDAGYDEAALLALLEDAPDLADTGFSGEELDQLLNDVAPEEQPAPDDADDLPEPATETVTQPGDLWELGRHRLVCGDSTEQAPFDTLMDGALADMIWTDPPYGVEYVGKTADALRIMNDGAAGLEGLLAAAFAAAARHARPGAPIYVAHADTERVTFENTLRAAGFDVRQNLVWVKNTMVLGHSDYHWKHEPILYGELPWAEALAGLVPSGIHAEAHQPLLYGFNGGGAWTAGTWWTSMVRGAERDHRVQVRQAAAQRRASDDEASRADPGAHAQQPPPARRSPGLLRRLRIDARGGRVPGRRSARDRAGPPLLRCHRPPVGQGHRRPAGTERDHDDHGGVRWEQRTSGASPSPAR